MKFLFLFLVAAPGLSQRLWSHEAPPVGGDGFSKALESIFAMPQAQKKSELARYANLSDLSLSGVPLSMNVGETLNKAPRELEGGWVAGADSESKIKRIAGGNVTLQMDIQRALICWSLFLDAAPEEALTAMLSRADANKATLADAVRIWAATERRPGQQLKQHVSKALWKRLHESNNPCLRILALEKYDSTEQSPTELLNLYRECLMDSFGYLQVRALEGIFRSKDFRPEVAELLRDYLDSGPAVDDGTLPAFPAVIANPVDGAKMILAEMSKSVGSASTTPSKALPSRPSSTVTAVPSKEPESKPTATTPNKDPIRSTWWSVIFVLIIGATSGMWLLLKIRK